MGVASRSEKWSQCLKTCILKPPNTGEKMFYCLNLCKHLSYWVYGHSRSFVITLDKKLRLFWKKSVICQSARSITTRTAISHHIWFPPTKMVTIDTVWSSWHFKTVYCSPVELYYQDWEKAISVHVHFSFFFLYVVAWNYRMSLAFC